MMRSQAAPPQASQPSASAPRQVQSFASDIPSSPPVIYNPQQEMSGFQSPPPQRADGGAALVVDTTSASAAEAAGGAAGGTIGAAEAPAGSQAPSAAGATLGARARAGTLANRSATVPQGTLIPAVIETAFNSNRGGFARAVVSRDVRGFDGSRVLIPRGSRLIGEYRADVAPGQRRALVNWVRLVRPDGVTMTIASPSTDTLGRAGMRANVNTHFFQRFGGALLRSVIDIGTSYATIRGRGSPVVLLPGAAQGATGGDDNQLRPTLTVPAGRSISVFVARDLDFGGAGGRE
jgi:type IV secretion system protein VirB10